MKIHNILTNGTDNNKTYNGLNCAHQIKNIFDNLAVSNIWIHHTDIDISFDLINQRITDTYSPGILQ